MKLLKANGKKFAAGFPTTMQHLWQVILLLLPWANQSLMRRLAEWKLKETFCLCVYVFVPPHHLLATGVGVFVVPVI